MINVIPSWRSFYDGLLWGRDPRFIHLDQGSMIGYLHQSIAVFGNTYSLIVRSLKLSPRGGP